MKKALLGKSLGMGVALVGSLASTKPASATANPDPMNVGMYGCADPGCYDNSLSGYAVCPASGTTDDGYTCAPGATAYVSTLFVDVLRASSNSGYLEAQIGDYTTDPVVWRAWAECSLNGQTIGWVWTDYLHCGDAQTSSDQCQGVYTHVDCPTGTAAVSGGVVLWAGVDWFTND